MHFSLFLKKITISVYKKIFYVLFILSLVYSCTDKPEQYFRPRDPWAFRSVLDMEPRMLTLALDSACYAAYDMANCRLYKVWKGGVTLEGAAYTDKKKHSANFVGNCL
jgi:cytochrome c